MATEQEPSQIEGYKELLEKVKELEERIVELERKTQGIDYDEVDE